MRPQPRFSKKVAQLLEKAGWKDGANRDFRLFLPTDFELFPAAQAVLEEFCGLEVGDKKGGSCCEAVHLSFDPRISEGAAEVFAKISPPLNTKLFPIADVDCGHATLLISQAGWIYIWFGPLQRVAKSFDKALEKLLLGLKYDEN